MVQFFVAFALETFCSDSKAMIGSSYSTDNESENE